MSQSLLQDAARQYIQMGLAVIPLCSFDHKGMSQQHLERCSCAGKAPLLKNWTAHRLTTPEHLQEWASTWPSMNLGLVLGQTEHWNIVGVDVDGEIGAQLLEEVSAGVIPPTWEYLTGNGRRLLYRLPSNMSTKKNKINVAGEKGELALLCTGQQTVMPPSRHHRGSYYRWVEGCAPQELDMADAPEWILARVKLDINSVEDLPGFYSGKPMSTPVIALENKQSYGEGERSNYLVRQAGALIAKGNMDRETAFMALVSLNQKNCKPPLEPQELEAMFDSVWNSEMRKQQKREIAARRREEQNPHVLAHKFLHAESLRGYQYRYMSERDRFYVAQEHVGPWRLLEELELQCCISAFLQDIDTGLIVQQTLSQIILNLKIHLVRMHGAGQEFDVGNELQKKPVGINVGNGYLDWRARKLIPWTLDQYSTVKLQADWVDTHALLPERQFWEQAMAEWLPDEQDRMFLQEFIGYCLTPDCSLRAATFIHGGGRNGKSMFLETIKRLWPMEYRCVTQPKTLTEGRFGTAQLIDKPLIVCTDISSAYIKDTSVLKALASGEAISAEYKGGKHFSFTPIGKMLFSANELPKAADKTEGWYSRLRLVHFAQKFEVNHEYHRHFEHTMNTSSGMSALLGWAVEGLNRLMERGVFTESAGMVQSKKAYVTDNDSVAAFMEDCVEPHDTMHVLNLAKRDCSLFLRPLYATFAEWAKEIGMQPCAERQFARRLTSLGYKIEDVRVSSSKTKTVNWRAIHGYKMKADTEFRTKESYERESGYQAL